MGVLSLSPNNESFPECNFYKGEVTIHIPDEKCWETQKEKSKDLENKNINKENKKNNNSNQILENELKIDEKLEKEKIQNEKNFIKREQKNKNLNININESKNELGNRNSINDINNIVYFQIKNNNK